MRPRRRRAGRPPSAAAPAALPPLPATPAVDVVVPVRAAARTLEATVRSVLDQEAPGPLTVVLAVAPSDDGTDAVAAALATDPRVHVVDNPAGTTPAGLNRAIAACGGEVVVRVDAHARLRPGYVARAVEVLRTTGAANVGGRQHAVAEGGFARAVAAAMASPAGAGGARYRQGGDPGPVETVYLGVFRRVALEAVGGFDERLVRNQDYELNHRLIDAGYVVWFDPGLVADYRPRDSVVGLWRQYHGYGVWKRHVLWMHPTSLRARQLAAPVLVVGLGAGGTLAAAGDARPLAWITGAYGIGVTVAAWRAAPDPGTAPATALALTVMHLAWGIGFLAGRRQVSGRRPTGPAGHLDGAVD